MGKSKKVRWYDDPVKMTEMIQKDGLKGLNRIRYARREAGYDRQERLQEYVFLGRYVADSCGNLGRISEESLVYADSFPVVIDLARFGRIIEHYSYSIESGIPHTGAICPVCGKKWDLKNVGETVMRHWYQTIALTPYIGRTLGSVVRSLGKKEKAFCFVQPDYSIRNDKYIDRRPDPEYPEFKINENGWIGERQGVTVDHVIQEGDEGAFNFWAYYHPQCHYALLLRTEWEYFKKIFEDAGFNRFKLTPIPNEYSNLGAPWFLVSTNLGLYKIGWRTRVISIHWGGGPEWENEPSYWKTNDVASLFADEEVTKGPNYIHAWGEKTAVEYLRRIHVLRYKQQLQSM